MNLPLWLIHYLDLSLNLKPEPETEFEPKPDDSINESSCGFEFNDDDEAVDIAVVFIDAWPLVLVLLL